MLKYMAILYTMFGRPLSVDFILFQTGYGVMRSNANTDQKKCFGYLGEFQKFQTFSQTLELTTKHKCILGEIENVLLTTLLATATLPGSFL